MFFICFSTPPRSYLPHLSAMAALAAAVKQAAFALVAPPTMTCSIINRRNEQFGSHSGQCKPNSAPPFATSEVQLTECCASCWCPWSICLALAGLEKLQEPPEEEDEFMVSDDTLLNRDNVAVNWDTKTEISPSSMTTAQMKAELESKGLPTDGVKRDLTRRVEVRPLGPLCLQCPWWACWDFTFASAQELVHVALTSQAAINWLGH